jgi:hypothetical protein
MQKGSHIERGRMGRRQLTTLMLAREALGLKTPIIVRMSDVSQDPLGNPKRKV